MTPNFALSALYALDNLEVMRGMDSETVPLIYADPPFNSKRMYQGMSGTKARAHRFRDTWSWNDAKQEWLDQLDNDYPKLRRLVQTAKDHSDGMGGYICFMAPRIIEMHRILTPDGSLYLHCDPSANSYLRLLLDLVFGGKNFRNEITWNYEKWTNAAKRFQRNHDTILWYTKTDRYVFNKQYHITKRKQVSIDRGWETNTVQAGRRQIMVYDWDKANAEIASKPVNHYDRVIDMNNKPVGSAIPDWWSGIPYLNSQARERTGWNTQKPLALLERIIKAGSNEGDIVFDPFCGCGTALVAAESLGRRWVGADDDANAIDVVRERVASLKGIVADQPQLQTAVSVLHEAPVRTEAPSQGGVLKDPTGIVIPTMPSDKMSNQAIKEQLLAWQTRDSGKIRCLGCDECMKPRHFDLDHIDPKSAGGTNRIDNRALLCHACNGDKSNTKTLEAIWKEQGIRGTRLKEKRAELRALRDQARLFVQQMDAGASVQAQLP